MKQDSDPELLWLNWANQSLGLRPTEHVFQTKQQKSTLKKAKMDAPQAWQSITQANTSAGVLALKALLFTV